LPAVLRLIHADVELKDMTKSDVESVVAAINGGPYKEWTKHDKKLTLRKLIQYVKEGSCTKDTPMPLEVKGISRIIKEKDPRVTPERLLSLEDFSAIVKAMVNKRDRAIVFVLFEAALRPGEFLTMRIGSV
jgi:integrase